MLVKNSIIYGLVSILRGIVTFLAISAYTRLLSPAEYGNYAILVAIVGFVDSFAFLWIRHTMMRHITYGDDGMNVEYLTNSLILYTLMAVISVVIGGAISPIFFDSTQDKIFLVSILAALIVLEAASNFVTFFARIRLLNSLFSFLNVAKPLLSLMAGAWLVYLGYGVNGAIYGMLAGSLVCTIVGIIYTSDLKKARHSLYSKRTISNIILFGAPLILAMSVQFAISVTDRFLLKILISDEVTGMYSVAQDLPMKLLVLIMSSIHLAAYPIAVKKFEQGGIPACKKQLSDNITLLYAISFPALVGMCVLAPGLINILIGEAFREFTIKYMAYFAVIAFLNCLIQFYFVLSFQLSKKTGLLVWPFLISLLINLAVSYFGILKIGVWGAILGAFAAYLFLLIAVILISRKIFPMPFPLKPILQITLASAVMGGILLLLSGEGLLNLIISIIIGLIIYAGLIIGLNVANSRVFLQELRKKI
jgi:O-antigen/teichoic acid export membrane protein